MTDNKPEPRFLPYKQTFDRMKAWRTVANWLLYTVSVLSVMVPLLSTSVSAQSPLALSIATFVNYVAMVGYYVVSVVTEVFLYPNAARQRRLNLIDNSLGSQFLGQASRGYFSNDNLQTGVYKLCVNCFENCFFTYNIAKGMQAGVIARNAAFALAFLTLAYVGISNNAIGLPVLQIFLSSLFLTQLIHHLNFTAKLGILLERFKLFFMDAKGNPIADRALHSTIALLMDYETSLAYNKGPMSDRVYHALNTQLTKDWDEMKAYYEIRDAKG